MPNQVSLSIPARILKVIVIILLVLLMLACLLWSYTQVDLLNWREDNLTASTVLPFNESVPLPPNNGTNAVDLELNEIDKERAIVLANAVVVELLLVLGIVAVSLNSSRLVILFSALFLPVSIAGVIWVLNEPCLDVILVTCIYLVVGLCVASFGWMVRSKPEQQFEAVNLNSDDPTDV